MNKRFDYKTRVQPEWIDHNGHMNVAYFVVAFDEATDAVYEQWGIGLTYPEESGCSVFTLGINVDYLAELFDNDPIRIETTLVDMDDKRIHYLHQLFHEETGILSARNECLCMNIDLDSRRSRHFPIAVRDRLRSNCHVGKRPDGIGRQLSISK